MLIWTQATQLYEEKKNDLSKYNLQKTKLHRFGTIWGRVNYEVNLSYPLISD